jgi:phage abiD protein
MVSPHKPALPIRSQVALLRSRGMHIDDQDVAMAFLQQVSYYRLEGYWLGLQDDSINHHFKPDVHFQDVVLRYSFDKALRALLFPALAQLEVAFRTRMVYIMSLSHGPLWYCDEELFDECQFKKQKADLMDGFSRGKDVFVKSYKTKYSISGQGARNPEAWIIFETTSLGLLSRVYKNISSQLPEKEKIARSFGLPNGAPLASWLEAITFLRNTVAHHSRLWGRSMVKSPQYPATLPEPWLSKSFFDLNRTTPATAISSLLYLCNHTKQDCPLKEATMRLLDKYSSLPLDRVGFSDGWQHQPIWRI